MITIFSKFMIDVNDDMPTFINNYYDYGLKNDVYQHIGRIKKKLESCINYDKHYIDGDRLEKELFKEINADVFISHSHADEKLAIAISGWLKKEMELTAFVDSCVWDYVDETLCELNNRYNVIRTETNGSKVYNHNKANYFASHLYLMLNAALNNMLDKTECLLFINTKNSVIPLDKTNVSGQTFSPWIYSEIVMANTMQQIEPQRYNVLKHSYKYAAEMNEQISITHKLNLSEFKSIDFDILYKWQKSKTQTEHAMDTLYKILAKGDILNG